MKIDTMKTGNSYRLIVFINISKMLFFSINILLPQTPYMYGDLIPMEFAKNTYLPQLTVILY